MSNHPFTGVHYPPSSVNLSKLDNNNAFDALDFGGIMNNSYSPGNNHNNMTGLVQNQPQQQQQQQQRMQMSRQNFHSYSQMNGSPKQDAPLSPDERYRHNSQNSLNSVQPNPIFISCDQVSKQSSEMPTTDNWCTIAYHELSSRIGEMFHVKRKDRRVTIDGFTEPSVKNNRFSLGVLNNINRSEVTRNVRQHIGKGIEVHWVNNVVMLKCVSENPVFVQSPNCNQKHGWNIATVVKVPKGCCLAIFDMDVFAKTLADEVKKGFEEVFALSKMCTVRISFVKGWGREYRRQSIMNTPCWIEIRLNGPLKWIDIVLNEIEGPKQVIGSCS